MNADGGGSQKITTLDRDPGGILWARDGSGVYFSVAREGTSNVYFAAATGSATAVTTGTHMVGATSISRTGIGAGVRTSFTEPPNVVRLDLTKRGTPNTTQLTHVNEDLLSRMRLATEERIVARSTNNTEVEGWIVKPRELRSVEEVSAYLRDPRRPARDVQRRVQHGLSELRRERISSCSTPTRAARPATARRSATRSTTTIRVPTTTI